MEPKDLKNSRELKSTESKEQEKEQPAKNESTEEKKPEENQTKQEEQKNVSGDSGRAEKEIESAENKKETANQDENVQDAEKAENSTPVNEEKEEKETSGEKNETALSGKPEESSEKEQDLKAEETESADEKTAETEPANEEEKEAVQPGEQIPEEKKNKKDTEVASSEEDQSKEKEGPAAAGVTDQAKTEKKEESPEKAEKKTEPVVEKQKPKQVEKPDYNKLNQVELVNALREVLDSNGEHDIKDDVEAIKAAFYRQVKEDVEIQKNEFIASGGNVEDFEPKDNPYEKDIKDLLKRYRQIRIDFNKKLDQEKEKNLELKYQIIEEIKGLINKEESINKTFNDFRDLQQQWREIGLVPQSKMKDLWENYHFHVENFYDYIKINKELRDLDLKKNLEMKIRLCEQAEELLLEPNIIKAFNALQKLHDRYREIGPVPRENKDDLWDRFKAATTKINKKHQEYFENRKSEQKKNLEAKRALCEQVEQINESDLSSHKDWNEKSKEVINIQKIWRTIGFAPRKDNNKIYDRFRKACDTFFDAKRDFYSKNKELQQNNLQAKIDLCVQAEALKDSTDWRKTTQDFINIQKQWKEIGPVPRKQSDAIWKRFRAACDYFFDQKSEHFSNIDSEQNENLEKKEQLVKDIQAFKSTGDVDKNLKMLKDFQRRWTEIGHVPIKKKDEIQKRFRESINRLYDELNLDEQKRNMLKFRTKMTSFSESSRGQNKMRFERDKYMNKLKQLESDLVLLENNIGFFANSKNAASLIEDVNKKIEATKQKIETLKNKIRVIDEMDQSEE